MFKLFLLVILLCERFIALALESSPFDPILTRDILLRVS